MAIQSIRLRCLEDGDTITVLPRRGAQRHLPVLSEAELLRRYDRAATPAATATPIAALDLVWIGLVSSAPVVVDAVVRWVA